MATTTCPSCGSVVAVSEALYCPFCGQALRRIFAEGSADAPKATPAPVVAKVPNATRAATSSESAQNQPPASWTPYPEQSAFQSVPTPEQSALGATPVSQVIRSQRVVVSALAVIVISALLTIEQFHITLWLMKLQGPAYDLIYGIEPLVLYSALALVAAYWLGWLRLAHRRVSHVTLEAVALCIVILVTAEMLFRLTLRLVGPSYFSFLNPFTWWNYLRDEPVMFVWILLFAIATGALGVRLASSCARWSVVTQSGRPASPIADFFKVFGACTLLHVAAAAVIVWVRLDNRIPYLAAVVVATLLAVRSGKRRVAKV